MHAGASSGTKGSVRKSRTDEGRGATGSISASTSGTTAPAPSSPSRRGRTTARSSEANINPYLGSKRLTDLSPIDVKRWHGKLLESGRRGQGLSVAPVKLGHRILRRALADAVRWNLIVTNPAAATRVPKGEPKELTVWSAADARRFLGALADDRLVGLWTLALHTGLRRGELAGLRWIDVDRDESTLTVDQQRTTANHQVVVTTPKAALRDAVAATVLGVFELFWR